jgi:hypothetical protein
MDDVYRENVRKNGYENSKWFSVKLIAKKYDAIYHEIMNENYCYRKTLVDTIA